MDGELLQVLLKIRKQLQYASLLPNEPSSAIVLRDCLFKIEALSAIREELNLDPHLGKKKKANAPQDSPTSMKHSEEDLVRLDEIATLLTKNRYDSIEDLRKILATSLPMARKFFHRQYDGFSSAWIETKHCLVLQLKQRGKLK